MKSGAVTSKYDQTIFTWYFANKLQGIIDVHIDDIYFSGSEIFQTSVLNRLCHVFSVKSEKFVEFQYIGLDIKNNGENIKLGLNECVKKLKYIPVEAGRNLKDAIFTTEITETKQIISQVNTQPTQTRLDINYDVSTLSFISKQVNMKSIKISQQNS